MIPHPFPIFLDLTDRPCVVIGSGPEAERKIAALRRAGAEVRCAAEFDPALLRNATLVMVAGASLATGEAVARAARSLGIPVNVMDEPGLCTFLMPAIVDRAPVVVAISTGGAAPALARLLRIRLERLLPARLGDLATLAARFRPLVRRRLAHLETRKRFWSDVFTGEVARLALDGEPAAGALADTLDSAARQGGGDASSAVPLPYSKSSAV
jgi:uroporphyrin-III C-methyltransferase/precorrin-2 dehydrogenase/sirohydrochlorin ferrochelatase